MKILLTIMAVGSLAVHIAEDTSSLLHVKFQSSNFENILTWDGGPENTPGTVYSVEYKRYGEKEWLTKTDCQQTTRKSCNLTVETGNLTELYYAKVTAVSPGGQPVSRITERFSSLQHTTIKPPDVTCVPKVRSIQMLVHPTFTPILSEDGHPLTLEEIFHDLFYRLELRVNHTYQMYLGGKQREYEFVGLTPDTEFLGSIKILAPMWSKESAPYVCRVKTLPDRTWTYSFSGAILFSMGFLVGLLCYLSYRYVTKPPAPPNSLNVQRVLTFQPLRFIQEHVLIPVLDLNGPSSLVQPIQYSQVMVSGPREPSRAAPRCSLPESSYIGQPEVSTVQPTDVPLQQTLSPPSDASKSAPDVDVQPPSYAPQVASDAKVPFYTPQQVVKSQPSSYAPQAILDSWSASYALCMEEPGKDSTPGTLSSPKHLRLKGQLQKETLAGSCLPVDLSLQGVTSLAEEEPSGVKSHHPPLELCTDRGPDGHLLHSEEPGAPGYLKETLSLLSSVQIEGHPVSLPLHTHSPSDPGLSPWGLLDSLVCPKDEGLLAKAMSQGAGVSELEQPTELDSLFKSLALTVQWES